MAYIPVLTEDRRLHGAIGAGVRPRHRVTRVASWSRLEALVRERPVTAAILDGDVLERLGGTVPALRRLEDRYPSLGLVLLAPWGLDPVLLFELGRAKAANLFLLPLDDLRRDLRGVVDRSLDRGTEALVVRSVSPYLPAPETRTVRLSLEAAERRWRTEDVARRVGLSRTHLSERLKSFGLPSLGHLLVWGRLLHGSAWLCDPGRSAQSVSRQLGYSSGAAFRRALRNYGGVTPTELIHTGGFNFVLDRFLTRCGMGRGLAVGGRTAA